MAERLNDRIEFRCTTAHRAALDELAERLELSPGLVMRSLLEGTSSIDGVELLPTLFRYSQADPANLHQIKPVTSPIPRRVEA